MKQTYIAFFEDRAGKRIDFERFSCKKVETVKKYIRELWNNSLYRVCTKGAEIVKIYATPDGIQAAEPAAIVEL